MRGHPTFPTWWWPFRCRDRETSPRVLWTRARLWDRRWCRRPRVVGHAVAAGERRRRPPMLPTPARPPRPTCSRAGSVAAATPLNCTTCRPEFRRSESVVPTEADPTDRPWTRAASMCWRRLQRLRRRRWASAARRRRNRRPAPRPRSASVGWTGVAWATSWRWSRTVSAAGTGGTPSRIARTAGWLVGLVRNAWIGSTVRRRTALDTPRHWGGSLKPHRGAISTIRPTILLAKSTTTRAERVSSSARIAQTEARER